MIKEVCMGECTIGSLEEYSWVLVDGSSDEIAGTAGDDVVDGFKSGT